MTALDPTKTTVGDLCTEALRECGAFGIGQTPLAEDLTGAQVRLQWMLQQWEREEYHVYHQVTLFKTSTGQQSYTIGPGGDFDTGAISARPARIEGAFLRQLINNQPVDYPLEILQSREDYNRVTLKQLTSFTGAVFLDTAWPLGNVFPVPIPQANIYQLHLSVLEQLPPSFANSAVQFALPYEYYYAMMTNLAIRLRPKYGVGSYPGDELPGLAKEALRTMKGSHVQISRLQMPSSMIRPGIYNIFSDRSY